MLLINKTLPTADICGIRIYTHVSKKAINKIKNPVDDFFDQE